MPGYQEEHCCRSKRNHHRKGQTPWLSKVDQQIHYCEEVSQETVGATTQNRDFTTTVGEYLDASQMSCQWASSDNTSFALKVVAVVGTKVEDRTYTISPRSI